MHARHRNECPFVLNFEILISVALVGVRPEARVTITPRQPGRIALVDRIGVPRIIAPVDDGEECQREEGEERGEGEREIHHNATPLTST